MPEKQEKNQPEWRVMLSAEQGERMQRIGSGWTNISKGGTEYITVQLGVFDSETKQIKPAKLKGNEKLILFRNELRG